MTNIALKDKIEDKIYEIRGKQVMLDSDLAELYKCVNGTKTINQAVKRNIERFPEDFYFQLTKAEVEELLRFQNGTLKNNKFSRSQIGTLNKNDDTRGYNIKYLPYVFTEQGVAMLASVLRTPVAAKVSIDIMRSFVLMRRYISKSLIEQNYINNLVLGHEERLKIVEEAFSKFKDKKDHLFFKGEVYDAYSLLIDILGKAKEEIIIIDNYIDKNILDILKDVNKKVIIITNKYNNKDYEKYKKQYSDIKVVINNEFHDRFIILDKKILYHSGASFKDLGNKCFEISEVTDEKTIKDLLKRL